MGQREYRQMYAEEAAVLHSFRSVAGVQFQEATRYWNMNLPPNELQAVIAEMDLYVSAKNESKQRWVECPGVNPRAGDKGPYQLDGVWRCAVNRIGKPNIEQSGIYQELYKGYLKPPLDGDWTGIDNLARITKIVDWTATGKSAIKPFFIVTYPNVAQETVREFTNALIPRGTLTNPTFDTQTQLTGTYKFAFVKNEEQDDGSSFVVATLIDASDPSGLAVLFSDNCGSKISRMIYMGTAIPPVVSSGSSGVEYFVRDFSFDMTMGLYSLQIEKVEQKTITTGIFESGENEIERNDAQTFLGVRANNLDENGNAVPLWTAGNPSAGVEYRQEITKNQNCTTDVRQTKRTVKNLTSAIIRKVRDLFHTQVATSNKADVAPLADPAAPSGGVIQSVENVKNGLGQYDTTLTVITELPVSAAVVADQKTLFQRQQTSIDKAQSLSTSLVVPAASGGVVVRKKGDLTPGNQLDIQTDTVTEQPVSNAGITNLATVFDTTATVLDRAQDPSTSLSASAGSGVIVEKRGEKTDGGLLNVTTVIKSEIPVTAAVVDNKATIFETVSRQLDKSQALSSSVAASASGGVITNKIGQETAGGLKDVTVEVIREVSVSSAATIKRLTAFDLTTETNNRNQTSNASDPTIAGQTVNNTKTIGGSVNQTLTTITPIFASVTNSSESRADQSVATVWEKNADAKVDAAGGGSGTIVRAISRKNELDKFDNVTETITAAELTASCTSEAREDQTATTVVTKNSAAAAAPAARSAGTITRASSRENEFGKFDNTVETIVSSAMTVSNTSETRADQDTTTVWEKNAAAKADAAAFVAGTISRATSRKNEFGKFDNVKETITANSQTATFSSTDNSGTTTHYVFKNISEADIDNYIATLTAVDQITTSATPNEFGKFNGIVSARVLSTGSGTGGLIWSKTGIIEYNQHEWHDNTGRHWLFTDKITYSIFLVSDRRYAETKKDGTGPGGWIQSEGKNWLVKNVTSITRSTIELGSATYGVWTPPTSPTTLF